ILARDVDGLRVLDVLHALRRAGGSRSAGEAARAHLGPAVVDATRSLEAALQASPHNVTLRELATATPDDPGSAAPRGEAAAAAPEPAAPGPPDPKLAAPA
ncbi:MAG TPA: hypothetical protein VGQ83_09195, partial [Polyangia bacterium]